MIMPAFCVCKSNLQQLCDHRLAVAMAVLLFGLILVTSPMYGQQDSKASAVTPVPQSVETSNSTRVGTLKSGEFYDKELDLHFHYPEEMVSLDASAEMEKGHQNIYGVSGDNDSEHQEAKRCIRPLLDADLPEDKAPHRNANMDGVWVDDSAKYKESRKAVPIFAKILVMEFVRDCLPKKLRKNENDALGSIAMSPVSIPGIQRQPNPLWYEVGKQKIHMNSGAGRPIVNGQLASAPIFIMAMSTEWRGHLLSWVFAANDTEVFNEISKSAVQFGDGPWGQMFPWRIGPVGSGVPINVLPK
jgi:hypothetical protein